MLSHRKLSGVVCAILWMAFGGCSDGPTEPPTKPTVVSVSVTPLSLSMREGEVKQFTCEVHYSDGSAAHNVTWSVTQGTITEAGVFTAPANLAGPVTATVRSCAKDAPEKCGAAQVQVVLLARIDSVRINPEQTQISASVSGLEGSLSSTSVQFTAAVYGRGDYSREVRWYVNGVEGGNAAVGTITPQGLYVAPVRACLDVPLMHFVSAVAVADPAATDSARVQVSEPPMGNEPRLCWTAKLPASSGIWFSTVGVEPSGDIIAGGFKSNPGGIRNAFAGYDKFGVSRWSKILPQPEAGVRRMTPAPVGGNYPFVGSNPMSTASYCGRIAGDGELVVDPAAHSMVGGVDLVRMYDGDIFLVRPSAIMRLDAACNLLEEVQLPTGRLAPDGFIVTGGHYFVTRVDQTEPVGVSNTNTYLEKFLRDGSRVCEHRFVDALNTSVALDAQGVVWVSGARMRSSGGYIWFIAKMDQDCNFVSSVEWETGVSYNAGLVRAMTLHPQSGVVLVGQISEPSGDMNITDLGVWAVDASLNTRWAIKRDFTHNYGDGASGVAFMPNGDMVLTGYFGDFDSDYGVLTKWRVPN